MDIKRLASTKCFDPCIKNFSQWMLSEIQIIMAIKLGEEINSD